MILSKWIPGQGFSLVQPTKDQKKTNLEILEIRLQQAEIKLGIRNG